MNEKPIFRCGLDITGAVHGEWQGVLRTDDETCEFRSVLELLHLIQSRAGPPLPDWKKNK